MKRALILAASPSLALLAFAAPPASATFHFMQIHQVIGGVLGDPSAQAVQLRMRSLGQGLVSASRLRAWDAAGANPVLLIDIPADVPVDTLGSKILIASAAFLDTTSPTTVADFLLTNLVPASYLPAGSITFEQSSGPGAGTVYWRLSWGGASYTGDTTGNQTNDDDFPVGEFGPPWSGALPSGGVEALRFQRPAGARSISNDTDYALTTGAAIFENNGADSFTIVDPTGVEVGSLSFLVEPRFVPNPFRSSTKLEFGLPRPARTTLIITNAAGRRVGRRDASLPAGLHAFDWSATELGAPLASGVYFYRLEAGEAVRTGQVVLLR